MSDLIISATVSSGGFTVSSGSVVTVSAGGFAGPNVIVLSGGAEYVTYEGGASGTTLSGGVEYVYVDGVASSTVVDSGGTEFVYSGASAPEIDLEPGGTVVVLSGASAAITNNGGTVVSTGIVFNQVSPVPSTTIEGAVTSNMLVSSGTVEFVLGGGSAVTNSVTSAGWLAVYSGGVATGAEVFQGGTLSLFGGTTISATVSGAGAINQLSAGSVESDTVLMGGAYQHVSAGGLAISTEVLDSTEDVYGRTTGTIVGSGGDVGAANGGVMVGTVVESGGNENVLGNATASGTVVSSGGTENVFFGGVDSSPIIAGGLDTISSGGTVVNPTLGTSATLAIRAGGIINGTITFNGANSDIDLYGTVLPTAPIAGFAPTDVIDLIGYTLPTGGAEPTLNAMTDVLTVPTGAGNVTLQLSGSYSGATFQVSADGGSGEQVTVLPCFAAGTRIAAWRDGALVSVAVEDLVVGDLVEARFGGRAPIVWIGERAVDCRRHAKPEAVWPVRVRAGAFGRGVPTRDLYLSPDHAVFEDGSLIPVRELINGGSIAQVRRARVHYYHIELAQHDVVRAEGLEVETFLDTGNRANFRGQAGVIALHPDFAAQVWDAMACAPLVIAGPALDAARRRLAGVSPRRGTETRAAMASR